MVLCSSILPLLLSLCWKLYVMSVEKHRFIWKVVLQPVLIRNWLKRYWMLWVICVLVDSLWLYYDMIVIYDMIVCDDKWLWEDYFWIKLMTYPQLISKQSFLLLLRLLRLLFTLLVVILLVIFIILVEFTVILAIIIEFLLLLHLISLFICPIDYLKTGKVLVEPCSIAI